MIFFVSWPVALLIFVYYILVKMIVVLAKVGIWLFVAAAAGIVMAARWVADSRRSV